MDDSAADSRSDRGTRQFDVDGDLVPAHAATVDVRDRGFRYGDAVVEPLRAYGGRIFAWPAHYTRLSRACETLAIDLPLSERALRKRVRATLSANDLLDASVELSVTGGRDVGPEPDRSVDPTVVITVESMPRGGSAGRRPWGHPATLETVAVEQVPDAALPSQVRSHSQLSAVLGYLAADDAVDDVLFRDRDGAVTQTATSAVFLASEGVLRTPSAALSVHPGVRRWFVLQIADELGIPVETGRFGLETVADADEVFVANTRWEIRPVRTIDGATYPVVGPVTEAIGTAFNRLVDDRHY
ncbi:MAG: aminotransferase class IV [Halanaeroarchaeum sp.]